MSAKYLLRHLGCASLLCIAQAHSTPLLQQAEQRVHAALTQVLPESLRAQATLRITVTAPRGAANHPCPTGWHWGDFTLTRWQRIHLPLSCNGKAGSLVAQVQVHAPVPVTTQALPRYHRLQPQDVQLRMQRLDGPDDVLPLEQLAGMQLRRALAQGQAVQPQHLERPLYAQKGERVAIRAGTEAVQVSVPGIALSNGYQGERIRVRNAHSQSWVEGVLIAPGVLQAERTQPGSGVTVQSSD